MDSAAVVAPAGSTGLLLSSLFAFTVIYMLFTWTMVGTLRVNPPPVSLRAVRNQSIFLTVLVVLPVAHFMYDQFLGGGKELLDRVLIATLLISIVVAAALSAAVAAIVTKRSTAARTLLKVSAAVTTAALGVATLALLGAAYNSAVLLARKT